MTVSVLRPSYRVDVSTAYDLGYTRGWLNAPRSESEEHYDPEGWLEGWEDGQADYDGVRGFRDS